MLTPATINPKDAMTVISICETRLLRLHAQSKHDLSPTQAMHYCARAAFVTLNTWASWEDGKRLIPEARKQLVMNKLGVNELCPKPM